MFGASRGGRGGRGGVAHVVRNKRREQAAGTVVGTVAGTVAVLTVWPSKCLAVYCTHIDVISVPFACSFCPFLISVPYFCSFLPVVLLFPTVFKSGVRPAPTCCIVRWLAPVSWWPTMLARDGPVRRFLLPMCLPPVLCRCLFRSTTEGTTEGTTTWGWHHCCTSWCRKTAHPPPTTKRRPLTRVPAAHRNT